jgi:Ran GTPase-activating protein (RanGAP) involved in mRNA processing and transport
MASGLANLTSLTKLSVSYSDIFEQAECTLLLNMQHMLYLDLKNTCIQGRHIQALTHSLAEMPDLTHLDMSLNYIGNDGLSVLSHALIRLTKMRHLYLYSTKLTSGAGHVAGNIISRMPSLRTLWLNGNNLSDDGVLSLVLYFKHVKRLSSLNLQNVSLSDRSLQALRTAHESGALAHLTELTVTENPRITKKVALDIVDLFDDCYVDCGYYDSEDED